MPLVSDAPSLTTPTIDTPKVEVPNTPAPVAAPVVPKVTNQGTMFTALRSIEAAIDDHPALVKLSHFIYDEDTNGAYLNDEAAVIAEAKSLADSVMALCLSTLACRNAPGVRGSFNERNYSANRAAFALIKGTTTDRRNVVSGLR